MPQNFVAIHNTTYKVLTQYMVWRIWCVNRDEWWRTSVDETTTDVGWNDDRRWIERNGNGCWIKQNETGGRMVTMLATTLQNNLCPQVLQWWHAEEKKEIFSCFFFIILFFFFFFQSYYTGYSLHDYKLKNTQECIAQMLTSKPMYKESKCIWGCIT
jgi:hypothetical protein